MPQSVNYVVIPPSNWVCESFNSYTPGSRIGTYAGWFSDASGPLVSTGIGVASSIGLDSGSTIFNWTAHPFNWNAADFQKFVAQNDFKTDGSGNFDDDRLSWTIGGTSTSSNNQFGVAARPPERRYCHLLVKRHWRN